MSLETDLRSVLVAICANVYPDIAPNDPPRPYITWQQIGGSLIAPLKNEWHNSRNAFIQINVFSDTRLEANTMAQAIHRALTETPLFIARASSEFIATLDEDTGLRGTIQDFSIWAAR
jgi:hypothetical protein